MTQQMWNDLSFAEQMSNIDGDVVRLVDSHEKALKDGCEDHAAFYLMRIEKLIKMTLFDPKNYQRGYRAIELFDELEEIKKYLYENNDKDSILEYWNQYTRSIS